MRSRACIWDFSSKREHDGVVGRVHIEAHDVDQLVLELRIARDLERLDQVGLEPPGLPLPLDRGPRETAVLRHRAVRPVRGIRGRRGAGVLDHLVDLVLGDHGLASPALVHLADPIDAVGLEVLAPLEDGRSRHPEIGRNRRVRHPVARHQQALGFTHCPVRQRDARRDLFECSPFLLGQAQRRSRSMCHAAH